MKQIISLNYDIFFILEPLPDHYIYLIKKKTTTTKTLLVFE